MTLKIKIEGGDSGLLDEAFKFNTRLQKMTDGQMITALHTFGSPRAF